MITVAHQKNGILSFEKKYVAGDICSSYSQTKLSQFVDNIKKGTTLSQKSSMR